MVLKLGPSLGTSAVIPLRGWAGGIQWCNPQDHATFRGGRSVLYSHKAASGFQGCKEHHGSLHSAPEAVETVKRTIVTHFWFAVALCEYKKVPSPQKWCDPGYRVTAFSPSLQLLSPAKIYTQGVWEPLIKVNGLLIFMWTVYWHKHLLTGVPEKQAPEHKCKVALPPRLQSHSEQGEQSRGIASVFFRLLKNLAFCPPSETPVIVQCEEGNAQCCSSNLHEQRNSQIRFPVHGQSVTLLPWD